MLVHLHSSNFKVAQACFSETVNLVSDVAQGTIGQYLPDAVQEDHMWQVRYGKGNMGSLANFDDGMVSREGRTYDVCDRFGNDITCIVEYNSLPMPSDPDASPFFRL